MSFEFYGGFLALRLLQDELHAPQEQAESVAEVIIRHQDLGETGKLTALGQLLQLATVFGEFDPTSLFSLSRRRSIYVSFTLAAHLP